MTEVALPEIRPVYPPNPMVQLRELEAAVRRIVAVLDRRLAVTRTDRDRLANLIENAREALAKIDARLDAQAVQVAALDARFGVYESRFLLVDELPLEAPLGALLRLRVGTVAQRLPLYLGNGAGQPLTKLTPTVV